MAALPSDPFAPPESTSEQDPLALDIRAPAPTARSATLADTAGAAQPTARKPVAYKRPDGGPATYIIWALAAAGLGALILGGARLMRGAVEGRPATPAGPNAQAAQPAAAAAPIQWKEVTRGDTVLVTIELHPRAARPATLLLDGSPLPSNPVSLTRGSKHAIAAVLDGYEPATVDVTADATKSVRLTLTRANTKTRAQR